MAELQLNTYIDIQSKLSEITIKVLFYELSCRLINKAINSYNQNV